MSIQDEYRWCATYSQVLVDFPNQKPFSNIVEAEVQHIGAVSKLFTSRGLAVPANRLGAGDIATFSSLTAACRAAADGETANYQMYDRFLAELKGEPADAVNVFTSLKDASRNRHLPAFIACAK